LPIELHRIIKTALILEAMNLNSFSAIYTWWIERRESGAHHWITKNLPYVFDTLDALQPEISKLPLSNPLGQRIQRKVEKPYTYTYNMFLSPRDYGTLRLILSLSGDLYNLLTPLVRNESACFEIGKYVKELYRLANAFRQIRNFFTHLDEVITDMDVHGISGPVSSACGIDYSESATNCVHLVWDRNTNTIYFTYHNYEYQVTIDKPTFQPIFKTATELYRELVKDKDISAMKVCSPEKLYPDVV
jgi:hypothetical protein